MSYSEEDEAQRRDRQIEGDLVAGRLDALLSEVDKEYEAGLLAALESEAVEMDKADWDQMRERVRRAANLE